MRRTQRRKRKWQKRRTQMIRDNEVRDYKFHLYEIDGERFELRSNQFSSKIGTLLWKADDRILSEIEFLLKEMELCEIFWSNLFIVKQKLMKTDRYFHSLRNCIQLWMLLSFRINLALSDVNLVSERVSWHELNCVEQKTQMDQDRREEELFKKFDLHSF